MNRVILVGNLSRDPELRTTQSGIACCNFTVAVNRKYVNQQTGQREADFISCVAWRQTAEFVHRYFIKGNKIGVSGSLQTRSYDAQDGSKRYVTEVLVDDAEFVAPKGDGQTAAQSPGYGQQTSSQSAPQQRPEQLRMDTSGFTEDDDNELPF